MQDIVQLNTKIQGADDTDFFQVSQLAIASLKQSIIDNKVPDTYFVRIKSTSGGCSGMNFSLEFDYEFDETKDREFDVEGLRIVTDSKTQFYIMGITLDYVDDEDMGGFIFKGYRDYPVCGCKS